MDGLERSVHHPDDSPGINNGADTRFLRDRLDAHMEAIRDHVRVAHPSAQFELLFAFDVNHDEPVGAFNLGGALNFAVNWHPDWDNPSGAPFELLKTEALDFGSGSRR